MRHFSKVFGSPIAFYVIVYVLNTEIMTCAVGCSFLFLCITYVCYNAIQGNTYVFWQKIQLYSVIDQLFYVVHTIKHM